MSLADVVQRAYKSTVRDALLLERAERIAASYPVSGQQTMREFFRAGVQRMNAAADLAESQPVAAPILYRAAAVAFVSAIVASRGEPVELDAGDAEKAFELVDAIRTELPAAPPEFDEGRRLLTSKDQLLFDKLEDDARGKVQVVSAVVQWLHDAIEPRPLVQIRRMRLLRLALIAIGVLGLLVWGGMALFSPKNLALHKPVTTSSVHASSTAVEGGLTDGSTGWPYGVHTAAEANPWVRVDLKDVYQLSKIKIYNRVDGWYDDGLPFTLELSETGADFTPVDHKSAPFDKSTPWVFAAGGKKARYIQVRGAPGKFVSLSEIEAYGKK